jgi:hypothetical protein
MSVSPYRHTEDFIILIKQHKKSEINYMNAFDLLDMNEKIILQLFLKRTPMSQVAYLFSRPTDVINNVRLEMIAKFEQASPVKSPETRSFKL